MVHHTALHHQLADLLAQKHGSTTDPQVVRVPYRVCPIGAHSDHQGGTVLGMAIDKGISLVWEPRRDSQIRISSLDFPGDISFWADDIPPARGGGFWGDYAAGAACAVIVVYMLGQLGLDKGLIGNLNAIKRELALVAGAFVLAARDSGEIWTAKDIARRLQDGVHSAMNNIKSGQVLKPAE